MSASGFAADDVRDLPFDRPDGEHLLLARQLAVIREMLGTLDTLTTAGQRHVMEKVVSFVDTRTRSRAVRMSNPNRGTLLELLAQLRWESQRLVPDPDRFSRRAENLITLLGAAR